MVSVNNAINKTVGATASGVTNQLTVTNPSNTASSAARESITVGGTSAANPTINWNIVGSTDFEMGLDNADSQKLKIAQSTALGTKDVWRMTKAGNRTMPLQCAFLYGTTTAQTNVTGDGTQYTLIFNSSQFDQNSNFDGTSTFTAPVTGIYFFYVSYTLQGLGAANTHGSLFFYKNGANAQAINLGNVGAYRDATNNLSAQANCYLKLTAADTIQVQTTVFFGTKTVSILNNVPETKFGGFLVC